MTHVVHPYSHRLGILKDWKSRWFPSGEKNYKAYLKTDLMLREFLLKHLRGFYIGGIDMERSAKTYRIMVKTARPGLLIGKSGEGVTKLKAEIMRFIRKHKLSTPADVRLDIEEIRSPESNAAIVALMVADGLEKRMPFRRVMKQMIDKVMANRDVEGVKMYMTGRLGGAEMAREEELKKGQVPLQTFRADIDFARERAHMTYGDIGIKVWIYKGEVFSKGKGKS